jgi:KRAB domain-containing zinc finger protein
MASLKLNDHNNHTEIKREDYNLRSSRSAPEECKTKVARKGKAKSSQRTGCKRKNVSTKKLQLRTQSLATEDQKACPDCEYSTLSSQHLKRHISNVHKKGQSYKCPECAFSTHDKGNLTRHVSVVHEKVKNYTCTNCQYKTARKDYLKKHVWHYHASQDSEDCLECAECRFKTPFADILRKHVANVHSAKETERNLKCEECGFVTHR